MDAPRKFDVPVTGEELFGSKLPDGLADVEMYPADQAELIELSRLAGRLVEGGPQVDYERIRSLHERFEHDETAQSELAELTKYVQWFRASYALGILDRGHQE